MSDSPPTPLIARAAAWCRNAIGLVLGRSEALLAGAFFMLIVIGTFLLSLPAAHSTGEVGFLDALFTATSAVCVTGLTVVDAGRDFSRFGQCVIMVLIQLGGLGIMTFAALAAQFLGRRLSFRQQAMIGNTFFQSDVATALRSDLRWIVGSTLVIEGVGAALLYLTFRHGSAGAPAGFTAVFHSISAFCNAGFCLYTDNLMMYDRHTGMLLTIMALITLGGVGHTVILEIVRRGLRILRRRREGPVCWSLNTRVVLRTSLVLIVGGAVLLALFGGRTPEMSWGHWLLQATFQSVSARTAGFNTVNIAALPLASLLVLLVLMFVGGSPGSCAGGIKTTSAVVWVTMLRARLKGNRDVTMLGRRLSEDVLSRVIVVVGLTVIWNAAGCLILALTEQAPQGIPLQHLVFEQVSAFGTVGMSTGITPQLSWMGKLWIIMSMFVGRVGPLTAALAVLPMASAKIRYPEERLMIG